MPLPYEEPIKIYIYPFLSDKYAPSHAALTYKDKNIDFSSAGFSHTSDSRHHGCLVYEIYPSDIGVDPKKLEQAIDRRKQNITGSDYSYLGQNCADQVLSVLREAGAKNLPKEQGMGIAVPSFDGAVKNAAIPLFANPVTGPLAMIASGQPTVEDYCKTHGCLAEVRKKEKEFDDMTDKFEAYMGILNDPAAFKAEMRRRCERELQGKNPYMHDEDDNGANEQVINNPLLSETDKKRLNNAYSEFLNRLNNGGKEPSNAEKMAIRAKYGALIAMADLPPETIRKQAWELYSSCGQDKLLQNTMWRIAEKNAPQEVMNRNIVKITTQTEFYKMLRNFGIHRSDPVDGEIKLPRGKDGNILDMRNVRERNGRA